MGTIRIAAFHGGGIRGILNLPSVIEQRVWEPPLAEACHRLLATACQLRLPRQSRRTLLSSLHLTQTQIASPSLAGLSSKPSPAASP